MNNSELKEHEKWRKFLAPLVGAAISALGIYATAAQQSYSHDNDARIAVIEQRIGEVETIKADIKELSKEVHELIGELRARNNFYRK